MSIEAMSLHAALRSVLLALDAVTAIVGEGAAARIRCDRFEPRDGEPGLAAILVEVDGDRPLVDLSGRSDLSETEITITCRAATRAATDALAAAVRTGGTNPGTGLAAHATEALDLLYDGTVPAWVPKADGTESGWYDAVQSYRASWRLTP